MASNNSRPSILVVDDNDGILSFLQEILRNSGYDCLTASSGKQSLDVLARERVDLAVLDYTMPDMTGDELAERIREQRPEMPLILYTGIPDDMPAEKLKFFTEVVAKPNCAELLNLIRTTTKTLTIY